MSDPSSPRDGGAETTGAAIARRRPGTSRDAAGVDDTDDWDDLNAPGGGDDGRDFDARHGHGFEPRRAGLTLSGPGRHAARRSTPDYGRLGLDAHHIAVLALLLAAVLAVAAWLVLKATPQATPVDLTNRRTVPSTSTAIPLSSAQSAPGPRSAAGGSLGTPATASEGTATTVVVDVTGKVRKPGIVELPTGARVVDALKAAGGARPGVRTNTLNLARPLVDGEQIVVGVKVPPVDLVPSAPLSGGSTTDAVTPVNLNTATQDQLETLPGIGPVIAAAILQWRTQNGGFTSVDQLLDVSGIGDVTLANIKAYVYV